MLKSWICRQVLLRSQEHRAAQRRLKAQQGQNSSRPLSADTSTVTTLEDGHQSSRRLDSNSRHSGGHTTTVTAGSKDNWDYTADDESSPNEGFFFGAILLSARFKYLFQSSVVSVCLALFKPRETCRRFYEALRRLFSSRPSQRSTARRPTVSASLNCLHPKTPNSTGLLTTTTDEPSFSSDDYLDSSATTSPRSHQKIGDIRQQPPTGANRDENDRIQSCKISITPPNVAAENSTAAIPPTHQPTLSSSVPISTSYSTDPQTLTTTTTTTQSSPITQTTTANTTDTSEAVSSAAKSKATENLYYDYSAMIEDWNAQSDERKGRGRSSRLVPIALPQLRRGEFDSASQIAQLDLLERHLQLLGDVLAEARPQRSVQNRNNNNSDDNSTIHNDSRDDGAAAHLTYFNGHQQSPQSPDIIRNGTRLSATEVSQSLRTDNLMVSPSSQSYSSVGSGYEVVEKASIDIVSEISERGRGGSEVAIQILPPQPSSLRELERREAANQDGASPEATANPWLRYAEACLKDFEMN